MRKVEFRSGNGEYVRGVLCEPSENGQHPVIIFVHGLLSSHEEFGDYPDRFAQRGYLTLAIDLRGHGQSDGPRGYLTDNRMTGDTLGALDFIQTLPAANARRITLFGHSLGGSIAICAAARDPRVTAVVAGALVGRLRDEVSAPEMLMYRIVDVVNRAQKRLTGKTMYFPYRVTYKDIFSDPAAASRAEGKGFLQHTTPVDNISMMMTQDAIACATRVRVPTLIAVSDQDRVVKHSNSRAVYDALAGEKEWYLIQGSGHSFATDCQKDVAFAKISDWIDKY